MELLSAQLSEASQGEFQLNYASFLCTSQGYGERRKDEMTTVLIPTYYNLEPDGYGSDLREGFRKRTVGGYFLTNPFQANLVIQLDNDILLNLRSNSVENFFLYCHPKIGFRLIRACDTRYELLFCERECIELMDHLILMDSNVPQYLEIRNAMKSTNTGMQNDKGQQMFETAEELIDQIETDVNHSVVNLSQNDIFLRILSDIIGFRTVHTDPFDNSKYIFLTTKQLACIDSDARIQIIHGEKGVGKTTTLLLKMLATARQIEERRKTLFYAATKREADKVKIALINSAADEKLTFQWPNEESDNDFKFPYDDIAQLNYEWIFVDDVSFLPHKARVWLSKTKRIHLVCAMSKSVELGLHQPSEWFQWIHLSERGITNETKLPSEDITQLTSEINQLHVELDYFSWSANEMSLHYPKWMDGRQTISIPACLDTINRITEHSEEGVESMVYVRKRETKEDNIRYGHDSAIIGQKAETFVFQAFQRLNLGGVMVANFSARKFWKSKKIDDMMDSAVKEKLKHFVQQQNFESDILFFHPKMGIFVIETKAKKGLKKAISQLEMMVMKKIPALFEILTGEELNVPINGALCLPNADLSLFDPHSSKIDLLIIDKSHCRNEESFRKFWLQKISEIGTTNNYFNNTALQRFICAIVAYRSAAVISHAINALNIYDILDSQSFLKETSAPTDEGSSGQSKSEKMIAIKLNDNQERTFFLNKEQLAIYKTDLQSRRHHIICGPPGTGKTLLIVLMALKAAKEKRNGRVIVKTRPAHVPKLRLMLNANYELKRKILVFDSVIDNENDGDDDDFFADELDITPSHQALLKRRSNCLGRTVVAVTCGVVTSQISEIQKELDTQEEFKFEIHELRKVIRGTQLIVDFWISELPSYKIIKGHSATGRPVENYCLKNSDLILERLLEEIKSFLSAWNENRSAKFGPNHLAVILSDVDFTYYVKSFLASENILCGSTEEQLNNHNLIAVVHFEDVLSYEWPIVLAVDFQAPGFTSTFKVISSSRAMAHLIYIERNLSHAQNIIDGKLRIQFNDVLESVTLDEIWNIVDEVSKELGETWQEITYYNYYFFIGRTGFIPCTLRSVELFSDCRNLFDLLKILTENEFLLRSIVTTFETNRKLMVMRRQGYDQGTYKIVYHRSSKLFDSFAQTESQQVMLSLFIERWGKIKEELTRDFVQDGSLKPVFHSEYQKDVLLQLTQTDYDWKDMKTMLEDVYTSYVYRYFCRL